MKRLRECVGLILLPLLLANCATIVREDEQAVSFSSNPPGADLTIDNEPYGRTPTMVKVERDRGDRIVSMSKRGYHTSTFALGEKPSAMSLGNIVFGVVGVVGVGVDALTGDNKDYENHVHIDLVPLSRPAPPAFVRD